MQRTSSVGWRVAVPLHGSESQGAGAAAASGSPSVLARPMSAPVLHMDLHRFAPSTTAKKLAAASAAAPSPAARVRPTRPQSATVQKQKMTLSFTAPSQHRPSSAQPRGATSSAARSPSADREVDAFKPRSLTPLSDKWLDAIEASKRPQPHRDIARRYAHDQGRRGAGRSSFFRGRETLLLTAIHAGDTREHAHSKHGESGVPRGSNRALHQGATAEQARPHCASRPPALGPPRSHRAPHPSPIPTRGRWTLKPASSSTRTNGPRPARLPPAASRAALCVSQPRRPPRAGGARGQGGQDALERLGQPPERLDCSQASLRGGAQSAARRRRAAAAQRAHLALGAGLPPRPRSRPRHAALSARPALAHAARLSASRQAAKAFRPASSPPSASPAL